MKKKLFLFIAVLLSGQLITAQENHLQIIPKPRKIIDGGKLVPLKENNLVYLDEKSELDEDYIGSLFADAGVKFQFTASANKANIQLFKSNENGVNGSYVLEVKEKKGAANIKASAPHREGLIYAVQSLLQILKKTESSFNVPVCKVIDAPEFQWRAYMLDESRHFHGMKTVKILLDEMARLKMNIFHWHLVDDPGWRIEIKKHPKLTSVGSKRDFTNMHISAEDWDKTHTERAYYTQDEIREVVAYAKIRGIDIIPEIEFPGHASASILAYPWLGTSSRKENKLVMGDLYNVTDPEVEKFFQSVLDEVIALFPFGVLHIGGDEAAHAHWENSKEVQDFMKANNLGNCSDLQLWGINRMSNYLASKSYKMIGWNEITGDNIRNDAHMKASTNGQLAKGTIVQFWDGDISLVEKAIKKGYDVVNSNRVDTYLDYTYDAIPLERAYAFNPVPEGIKDDDKKKILGLGCQMWGEFIPTTERLYYQTFPRLAAYSEGGWSSHDQKDYAEFLARFKAVLEPTWKHKGFLINQPY